ncbi:MAG: PTS sugar transporter subunit IIC [Actinobacteria bacterium]|nr:PTS sugar transporter subunit IIC [Actinomycetota bacterium]
MKRPTLTRRGSRAATALTLFASTLIVAIGFPSVASAFSRGDVATAEITSVSLIQAILIGLGYYLSQSPWLVGLGFFTLYRPLVAGFIVGLIMGDPGQGALIGAAINLIYLGFISAGGSLPGDPALAGWVGTTIALAGGLNYGAALALAVPLGLLGTVIWNGRMTVDSIFIHMADKAADEADIGGVVRANIMYPQIFLFCITAVPVTTFVYLGTKFITDLINGFPIWLLSGLAICGGVLPAIGIAMNMRFIFRGSAAPYFFLGYLGIVAGGAQMSIMVLAIVGVALAFLHVTLLGDRVSQHAVQKAPSGASNGGGSE